VLVSLNQKSKNLIHTANDHKCAYCGEESDHIDHIVPKNPDDFMVISGKDDLTNLVPACANCNLRKRSKLLDKKWIEHAKEIALRNMPFVMGHLGAKPLDRQIYFYGIAVSDTKAWPTKDTLALFALLQEYDLKSWQHFGPILGKTEKQVRAN